MKTDRELTILAAQAAGLEFAVTQPFIGLQLSNGNTWCPLTDDGDALRLAVKLKLEIGRSKYNDKTVYVGCVDSAPWHEEAYEDHEVCAATRRAIVRAAAAIAEEGRA